MQVGKVTRGALKNMSEATADKYHKNLDINMESKVNKRISEVIQDRGKTVNAFEGDNHFHNIREQRPARKTFSQLMQRDDKSISCGGQ